ncbi:MAG: type II secretion system protein [Rickettsiales bacterium]
MQRSTRQAGFTLIEMTLVIAIIGLLVGGLLGIQAYLKSAELTTLMNQSKYYINAYNQFKDRYQFPPGDLATAGSIWSGVNGGDGNGLIRAAGSTNTVELFLAFQHLAKAGLIDGNYTGATTGGGGTFYATAGTNVPLMAVRNVSVILDHPNALDGNVIGESPYFDGLYGHVLRVAGLLPNANSIPATGFMSPQTALKLDSKFDDGVPNAGWVMTGNATVLPNCSISSGTLYSVAYTADDACYFIMRIQ